MNKNYITFPHLGKKGRLGNQLLQICGTAGAVKQHNIQHNTNYQVAMPQWEYQKVFSFPEEWFVENTNIKQSTSVSTIVEKQYSYYFGDMKFFSIIYDDIQRWLQPSPLAQEILGEYIKQYLPKNKTSIHIRRGDYQHWYKGINLLGKEYYEKNWPQGEILIFSDDPQWCKENFPGHKIVNNDPWIDLSLMRKCKAHVISNSSFAWWGAYGSNNVTCPSPWAKHKNPNIIPQHWKKSSWL